MMMMMMMMMNRLGIPLSDCDRSNAFLLYRQNGCLLEI